MKFQIHPILTVHTYSCINYSGFGGSVPKGPCKLTIMFSLLSNYTEQHCITWLLSNDTAFTRLLSQLQHITQLLSNYTALHDSSVKIKNHPDEAWQMYGYIWYFVVKNVSIPQHSMCFRAAVKQRSLHTSAGLTDLSSNP